MVMKNVRTSLVAVSMFCISTCLKDVVVSFPGYTVKLALASCIQHSEEYNGISGQKAILEINLFYVIS